MEAWGGFCLLLSQHYIFFMNARELRRTLEENLNEKAEEIERLKGAFTCGICVTEVFSRASIAGFFLVIPCRM